MTVHQYTHRAIVPILGSIGLLFLALAILLVVTAPAEDVTIAWGLVAFIAVGYAVVVTRMVLLLKSCWVTVTQTTITWQTPRRQRRAASPSGSVPVAAVHGATVVPSVFSSARFGGLRGHVVVLHMADGETVTLPIWTPERKLSPQLASLLGALRGVLPATVPFDHAPSQGTAR